MAEVEVKLENIPVAKILRNPSQPREDFDEGALQELANSIKEHGVQSPIRVRKRSKDVYELITGERRLRASKIAGLEVIPALVGDVEDEKLLELAMIENVQRKDLTPIEEAKGYRALCDKYNGDIDVVSVKTGKTKQNIEGRLVLLDLPLEVQQMIDRKDLTLGCAEVLCELEKTDDIVKYARMAVKLQLSPPKLRARIQHLKRKEGKGESTRRKKAISHKAVSKSMIACYEIVGDADVSAIPNDVRENLAQQANVLKEELDRFVASLTGVESAPAGSGHAEGEE